MEKKSLCPMPHQLPPEGSKSRPRVPFAEKKREKKAKKGGGVKKSSNLHCKNKRGSEKKGTNLKKVREDYRSNKIRNQLREDTPEGSHANNWGSSFC